MHYKERDKFKKLEAIINGNRKTNSATKQMELMNHLMKGSKTRVLEFGTSQDLAIAFTYEHLNDKQREKLHIYVIGYEHQQPNTTSQEQMIQKGFLKVNQPIQIKSFPLTGTTMAGTIYQIPTNGLNMDPIIETLEKALV